MTRSAPMDRTISTFLVLHTPVTSAPNHLAICTANVPTSSRCTVNQDPLSRLNVSLVAKTLQCGECRHAYRSRLLKCHIIGFMANADSEVHAYSVKAPRHEPNTSSPGLNCVTLLPTASTWPATSTPSRVTFGFVKPGHYAKEVRRASHVVPVQWIDGSCATLSSHISDLNLSN